MLNKRGILILITSVTLQSFCFAQSPYATILTNMENSLFGMNYASQSDTIRLNRIEEAVYGKKSSTSSTQNRITKLSKDMNADYLGKEIKPKRDSFDNEENSNNLNEIPKADKNIQYPTVDSLEETVFSKTFKNLDITQRLAKLEQETYKKTFDNDDLNTRVERLQKVISPAEKVAKSDENNSDYIYYDSKDNDYNSKYDPTSGSPTYGDNDRNDYGNPTGYGINIPDFNKHNSILDSFNKNNFNNYDNDFNNEKSDDIVFSLNALEKKILRKTYPEDTTSNRLLRMELKLFNASFTEDDVNTRFNRLASAYQAKKSSAKYDDNKFAKHAATAMQIGAILLMILACIL